jgi:YYY domain-containing protein
MAMQIVIWWLVIQAFGLAGLPLAHFLFRALPDRGYAFAKPLGLLLTGYLAWLLAMLGLAPFGTGLLVVSALVVGGVGLVVTREQRTKNKEQNQADRSQFSIFNFQFSIPSGWRLVLGYEALFALALVFLALLRSYNPTPWGTERPMDFALFNAIRRSATFPPHDPWLAGYSINYYYFGYMLMAAMALISGLEPPVAFNLSLALIFALTALGVAGVVFNLIALTPIADQRRSVREVAAPPADEGPLEAQGARIKDREGSILDLRSSILGRLGAILLTVVMVLLASNQAGVLQIVTGTEISVALKGQQLAQAITNGLGPRQPLYLDPPFKANGWDFDGTRVISPTDKLADFNWWWPSRAVWDDYPDPENPGGQPFRRYTITEFPFFSFWLGDMHPHVMALPFGLLALALGLQTIARPAAPPFAMGRRGWLELALTGIVLGSLYAINSWDFPTYLLLFLGALLLLYMRLGTPQDISPAHPLTRSPLHNVWWRHYLSQAVLVMLASVVMLAPFYMTFRSLVGGKEPLINAPILATITRTLGFVTSSRTTIYSFLLIFGMFLLPLTVYVVAQGRRTGANLTRSPAHPLTRSLLWLALAALAIGLLIGFPLMALLPLAIYAMALALRGADQPAAAFVLWAFALVCLICLGTEIIYIRDGFEGGSSRMNTIFKFYYQAWLLWGVLAGYALWWLASRRPTTDKRQTTTDDRRREAHESQIEAETRSAKRGATALGLCSTLHDPRSALLSRWSVVGGRWLVMGLFAVLLVGALLYPWLTAGKTFREDQRIGLDGRTPREGTAEGAAAITWLRKNVPGNVVVLEAVGGSYSPEGFGGVSAATGLATVLGWPGHEDQWRGGDPQGRAQIGPRQQDVATIYTTVDLAQARALLTKYRVDYIFIGSLEREVIAQAGAPPPALDKFAQLGEPVFQQGDVTIYRVRK